MALKPKVSLDAEEQCGIVAVLKYFDSNLSERTAVRSSQSLFCTVLGLALLNRLSRLAYDSSDSHSDNDNHIAN